MVGTASHSVLDSHYERHQHSRKSNRSIETILSRKRGRCAGWILPRTEQILHAAFYWILLKEIERSVMFDKISEEMYQNWNM